MTNSDGDHVATLDELLGIKDLDNRTIPQALQIIGALVDLAGDAGHEQGLSLALGWSEVLSTRSLDEAQKAQLSYLRANLWAHRRHSRHKDRVASWRWEEQPELEHEVLELRRAVRSDGFGTLSVYLQCAILTNLAGLLDTLGRFVEALEYWGRALVLNPKFGMALGNRGRGLWTYAVEAYHPWHQHHLINAAYSSINQAFSDDAIYTDGDGPAIEFFLETRREIEARVDPEYLHKTPLAKAEAPGKSKAERTYRQWCLDEGLFLNPLNDLNVGGIAAVDDLLLPSFVTPIHQPPSLMGFFNQMKQEYAGARWAAYEGIRKKGFHFADRDVDLYNTLDYASYSMAIERTRQAFRSAYSIFDKIGVFINEYMKLGSPAKSVYFKSVWYKNLDARQKVLRDEFTNIENLAMRGLYWLAKDLHQEGFRDVMEPEAQALYDIRNQLEHGYLKVHELLIPQPEDLNSPERWWHDTMAYSIQRENFEAKTLRVLKLVRASLIYLCFAMHREERTRMQDAGRPSAPMELETLDDRRKY
jgi:tetratricopeptide (TPR) repeat protein